MSQPVITRFAPSPTGFLHIGGARTALFNWLYARSTGGKMLLRIEDTDRKRSSDEAITAIYRSLEWLGLDWDGDAVSQVSRQDRHIEIANQLLAEGKAYKCYCSPEELQAMRDLAMAEKRPIRYDGTWRDRDEADAPAGVAPVIRFKSPQSGEMVIEDRVQGRVVFQNAELDDLIILRSDETPTYNLSVVCDDHDMAVNHIIRGVDHLTNTARQSQIYLALGWEIPVMAHIPLIHGPDGAKLSKRHGALGVEAYRDMGYLPAAMRNYLARLSWSHGDDEIFSTEQMLEWFDLDGIGKSAARFDFAKLENLNGHYMRISDDDTLIAAMQALFTTTEAGEWFNSRATPDVMQKLKTAMPALKERAKTVLELMDLSRFLFAQHPLSMDDKAEKLLTDDARAILRQCHDRLTAVSDWSASTLEQQVRTIADENELKLGKVAQPLRAALTGTNVSPPIFDVIAILGRDEALARINAQSA